MTTRGRDRTIYTLEDVVVQLQASQQRMTIALWVALASIVVAAMAGLFVGQRIGLAKAQDHAEITCDVNDILDREAWQPIAGAAAPAWTIRCEGYAKPGTIIVLD